MKLVHRNGRTELVVSHSLADAKAAFRKLVEGPVDIDRKTKWRTRTTCPVPRPLGLTRITERGQQFANYFNFSERSRASKPGRVSAQELLRRHMRRETIAVDNAIARLQRVSPYDRSSVAELLPLAIKTNSALMSVNQFPAHVAQAFARALGARTVLDFCGGWGDRLAGFLASPTVRRIVIVEPRRASHKAYRMEHQHSGRTNVDVVTVPDVAEHALPNMRGKFDLIMTSPPYGGAEIYDKATHGTTAATQPGTAFVDEWLGPILRRCIAMLRPGGALVINVDDSPSNNVTICARLLRYMQKVECDFVGTIGLRKRGRPRGLQGGDITPMAEPIYIWCRPGETHRVRAAIVDTDRLSLRR